MAPLPQLSTEVISHIIKLSLPHESFSNFSERSATLRAFALVSPLWRGLAQNELIASPLVLRNDTVARRYMASLDLQPWQAARVHSLRLGHPTTPGSALRLASAEEVLRRLTEVRRVVITGVGNFALQWFHSSTALQTLVIIGSTFAPLSCQPVHFSHLSHLSLSSSPFPHHSDLSLFLSPHSLPMLRSFGFFDSGGMGAELWPIITALLPRVEALSLSLDLKTLPPEFLSSTAQDPALRKAMFSVPLWDLDVFALSDTTYGVNALQEAVGEKHHLRLYCIKDASLEHLAHCLKNGQLRLAQVQSLYLDPAPGDDDAVVDRLRKLLRGQGTTLYVEDTPNWREESMISPTFLKLRRGSAK